MVSDNMYVWAGLIALDYILFLRNKKFLQQILGGLMLILIGFGGYMFLSVNMPWGLIVCFLGIMHLVITLMKV